MRKPLKMTVLRIAALFNVVPFFRLLGIFLGLLRRLKVTWGLESIEVTSE